MSLGDHLAELRKRLFIAVLALAVAFVLVYNWRLSAFALIQWPHAEAVDMINEARVEHFEARLLEARAQGEEQDPAQWFEAGYPEKKVLSARYRNDERLVNFGSDQGFMILLRVTFWLALFLAAPVMLHQMWAFIAAGLYRRERGMVYRYLPVSLLLFLAGVWFGYRYLVLYALYFLGLEDIGLEAMSVTAQSAENYLAFLKSLALAMGAVFQLPVLMLALSRLDLVGVDTWARFRRHMIVGALILGAILTPQDPVSQLLMAGPIILLYEVGIVVARFAVRRAQAKAA